MAESHPSPAGGAPQEALQTAFAYLLPYIRHDPECAWQSGDDEGCDCGASRALDAYRRASVGSAPAGGGPPEPSEAADAAARAAWYGWQEDRGPDSWGRLRAALLAAYTVDFGAAPSGAGDGQPTEGGKRESFLAAWVRDIAEDITTTEAHRQKLRKLSRGLDELLPDDLSRDVASIAVSRAFEPCERCQHHESCASRHLLCIMPDVRAHEARRAAPPPAPAEEQTP